MRAFDNPTGDVTLHMTKREAVAFLAETANGKATPPQLALLRKLIGVALDAAQERARGERR